MLRTSWDLETKSGIVQIDADVLLREWGLIDLKGVIEESKYNDPNSWQEIPEEALTGDLGMNEEQVDKWKIGLSGLRRSRQKWAEFWLGLNCNDQELIDEVWSNPNDIMKLMDFQRVSEMDKAQQIAHQNALDNSKIATESKTKMIEISQEINKLQSEIEEMNFKALNGLSEASESVKDIEHDQWMELKQSKSPLIEKTMKAVFMVLDKVEEAQEWKWMDAQKTLDEKQLQRQLTVFETTVLSDDVLGKLKAMGSLARTLFDEWGLIDVTDRITTAMDESKYDIDDPISWQEIPEDKLEEEPFSMNKDQIKKWKNGLKKYLKMKEEERMEREWTFEMVNAESRVGGTLFMWVQAQSAYSLNAMETKPKKEEVVKLQDSLDRMKQSRQSLEEQVKLLTKQIKDTKREKQSQKKEREMQVIQAQNAVNKISGEQLKLLSNTKKPSNAMNSTLKAVWLMLRREDTDKWSWKEAQSMLTDKEFITDIEQWDQSQFDEKQCENVQGVFPKTFMEEQEDWSTLLLEWDLAKFGDKMIEFMMNQDGIDMYNPSNWENISDQQLTDYFKMKKKHKRKWNNGLTKYQVVRILMKWISAQIECFQIPIRLDAEVKALSNKLTECQELLVGHGLLLDEYVPQHPNERFIERVWKHERDVTSVYVECIHKLRTIK